MLKVFLRQFSRRSCVLKNISVNRTTSRCFMCTSRSSGQSNKETVSAVAITACLRSGCHCRNMFSYSINCSTRVLVQNLLQFSTQSSAKLQKKTSDFSDKASSDSESNEGKISETHRIDRIEPTDMPIDVDTEMLRYDYEEFELTDDQNVKPEVKEKAKRKLPFEQQRGQSGVFDLEELCALLRKDNARDICAISLPPELKYVDVIVLATGRSTRHLRAMAEYIQWAYKRKRSKSDPEFVKLEGELTNDWFALDLGNIAVHLMLSQTRKTYDLEQLWAVGPEFDEQTRARSLDDVNAAASLEEFSFDVELEKLRKLRTEEEEEKGLKAEPKRSRNKKTVEKQTMESLRGWHSAI